MEKYFNPAVKAQRVLYSLFIIVLMILLVLGLVSVVFYLQYYITSDNVSDALDFVCFSMFSSLYRYNLGDVLHAHFILYLCEFCFQTNAHFTQVSEAWTPPGNAAVAIFSAVQIIVLNIYYSQLAIDLNNQENHRYSMCVMRSLLLVVMQYL